MNNMLTLQIIESPSADEIFDGKTEGMALRAALDLAGIPHQYNIAVNAEKFGEALDLFVNSIAHAPAALPVLHLSMHGSPEGVSLTDGVFFNWEELRGLLVAVAQGRLLVCMSSCYGFSGCRMAMRHEPQLPFIALVGHDQTMGLADAAIGYSAFYHRLFKGTPPTQAVAAMRAASGDNRFHCVLGTHVQGAWRAEEARAAQEQLRQEIAEILERHPGFGFGGV